MRDDECEWETVAHELFLAVSAALLGWESEHTTEAMHAYADLVLRKEVERGE